MLSVHGPLHTDYTACSKLERIVIGGTKGKALTSTLEAIFADFKAAVSAFEAVPYDM